MSSQKSPAAGSTGSPKAVPKKSKNTAPPPVSRAASRNGSIKNVTFGQNNLDDYGSLDSLCESNEGFLVDADGLMPYDEEDEDSSADEMENIGARLHGNSVYNVNRERNEAIVSILPSETLRWIKKRRKRDSKLKVAMSHFRERQLREIFNGLDYKTEGEINLEDLKKACAYVEESLEGLGKKGEQLTNLQEMFSLMDEDKSGSIDFQEFCAGMSGSSKSAIDSASEHAIDKLHWKFVEYSRIYKRQKAIDEIYSHEDEKKTDSDRYNSFRTLFNVGWGLKSHTIKNFDKDQEAEKELKLKQMGSAAPSASNTRTGTATTVTSTGSAASGSAAGHRDGHTGEDDGSQVSGMSSSTAAATGSGTGSASAGAGDHDIAHGKHHKHVGVPPGADADTLHKHHRKHLSHSASVSQILFMTEGRKLYMPSKADSAAAAAAMAAHGVEMPIANMNVEDKNAAYEELQARLRCHRIIAQENMLRDPDARQVQRRIEQEAKFIRDKMSYHPGVDKKTKPKLAKNMTHTFEPLIAPRNTIAEVRARTEQQMKLHAIKQAQLLGVTSNYNSLTPHPSRPVSPTVRLLKPLSVAEKREEDAKLKALDKIYSESNYFQQYGHYDEAEENAFYAGGQQQQGKSFRRTLGGGNNSRRRLRGHKGKGTGSMGDSDVGDDCDDNDSLGSEGTLQQRREKRANERLRHHEQAFKLASAVKKSMSAGELPHNTNTFVSMIPYPLGEEPPAGSSRPSTATGAGTGAGAGIGTCTGTGSRPTSPYVPVPTLSNSTNPLIPRTNPIPDEHAVKQRKRATSPAGIRPKEIEIYQFHNEPDAAGKQAKTVIGTAFMKTGFVANTRNLKALTNQRKHKLNSIATRSAKQLGYFPLSPNRLK